MKTPSASELLVQETRTAERLRLLMLANECKTNAVKKVLETPNLEETERGYAFCKKQTNANFKNKITNLFLDV